MTIMSEIPQAPADYEILPGTIFLVDVLKNHGELVHASGNNAVVLVPQPSDDPRDPLRWSNGKKCIFIAVLWIYALLLGSITLEIATVYTDVREVIGASALQMNTGAALQLIFLGVGNVCCIPLTLKFGRRPVYLGSMLILLASQLLQMSITTIGEFYGCYILSGIGAAPFDVLVEISFSDVTFAHQRGSIIAFYLLAPSIGSFLGPLWQGHMATAMGSWRWVMRWGVIFCGMIILAMFFFLEESLFYRDAAHREIVYDGNLDDAAAEDHARSPEEGSKKAQAVARTSKASSLPAVIPTQSSVGILSKYALWKEFPIPWSIVFDKVLAGITSISYPAVLWGGVLYGIIISWLTIMATTEASFFFGAPWFFNPSQVGNLNIAPFIGSVLGVPVAGFINNKIILWLARRNRGYSEAEFRLWILLPLSLFQALGLLMYGIGVARGLPWIVPAVGMGFIGFCLVSGVSILLSYVLDCYKEIGEEAITGVIFVRAFIGTGFAFAIQPWIEASGVEITFIICAVIGWAGLASAVIFIKWGKTFRRMTAERYMKASLETL